MLLEVKNEDAAYIGEIPQYITVKFSFAHYFPKEKRVVRLHDWVKCRDFLGDVLHANKYNIAHSLYGFNTSLDKSPIDLEKTTLLIKHNTTITTFRKNISHILHAFEEREGISLTKFVHFKGHTIVIGDKKWQESIPMISLYTLLLRAACYKLATPELWYLELIRRYTRHHIMLDVKYLTEVWPTIMKCSGNVLEIFSGEGLTGQTNDKEQSISLVHGTSGITTVVKNLSLIDYKHNLYTNKLRSFLGNFK